jgi:hypothetical protein
VKARVGWLVREAQPEDEERGEPGTTRSPIVTNSPLENKFHVPEFPWGNVAGTHRDRSPKAAPSHRAATGKAGFH